MENSCIASIHPVNIPVYATTISVALHTSNLAGQPELVICRCETCNHRSRRACVDERCQCCDLEDMFSILAGVDAASL